MTENLYCKIFVDTISEYDDFFEVVRSFLDGHKKAVSFIVNDWCSTSISRNKEYIPESPDFLYWKFIVDTEPHGNISDNVYIQNVRTFMDFLKLRYNAVCSCDFEELL